MEKRKSKKLKAAKCEFRCTEQEKKVILQQAKDCNKSISEYMRILLFEKKGAENIKAISEANELIHKLDWNLAKIGTNINQIAKQCNSKRFASSKDIEEVKKYMTLLSELFNELIHRLAQIENGDRS